MCRIRDRVIGRRAEDTSLDALATANVYRNLIASRVALAIVIAAVFSLSAVSSVAFARQQSGADARNFRQACEADCRSFCSGVQSGGDRIIAGLQQNAV